MKRLSWLFPMLLWLLAACGAGTPDTLTPSDVNEPGADSQATIAPATAEANAAEPTAASGDAGDPTLARDRDWKLGDTVDPAVTIIEYGDFQ